MADLGLNRMQLTTQVRDSEEHKLMQRKRNLLVLVGHYLHQQGYIQTIECLKSEVTLKLDQYVVCDNIDLELILQEFETFHYLKFQRQPQIVKKVQEEQKSNVQRKKNAGKRLLLRQSNMASHFTISPGAKEDSGPSLINKPMTSQDEKSGCGDLILEGVPCGFIENGRKPVRSCKKMITPEASFDEEPRLLRPLGAFSHYSTEWRHLAEVIAKDIYQENPNVKWSDIVGLEKAKKLIKEAVIYPVKYPDLFSDILIPWEGLLLYGPPGSGKTLLAKAVATECHTTFFNISASTLVSKWRGESEKLVRALFELAHFHAPSTIFLDEVDSLMSHRGSGSGSEHEATRRMKAELLTQMDGLAASNDLVFVLAASNLPWELDHAMLRRLEKRILVPLPSYEERESMFQKFLPPRIEKNGEYQLLCDLEYSQLSEATEGYSGADIKLVCKEARMNSLRNVFDQLDQPSTGESVVQVTVQPVTTLDVLEAISHTKPSARALASKYELWQKEYGCI